MIALAVLLIVLVGLVTARSALGATLTVTNLNDSGPGSLRATLAGASSGDVITFAVTGTITLTGGALPITTNVTIKGPGATVLTVSGNSASQVFNVADGTVATISGLTVANGNGGSGGGIYNNGSLTLDSVQVAQNAASDGGGVYNDLGGALTLRNTSITGNQATGNVDGGVAGGGGIFNEGTLTASTSLIANNSAQQFGAGLINYLNGTANLTNVTVSDNTSSGDAGGIYNNDGNIPGSTNSVSLTSVTVTSNVAQGGAGGLDDYGSVTLQGTILAGNTAGTQNNDCRTLYSFALNSGGYNLIGHTPSTDTAPCTITGNTTGNQIGVDPQLGPLDSYGGPTQTHLPLPGSPVVDAGGPTCPTTDQRNVPRPSGSACDIGAVEIGPFTVTTTADSGLGSLRQAINDANAFGQAVQTHELGWGPPTVAFAIPGGGVHTIEPQNSSPTVALPVITQPVVIDGWSQGGPDYTGPPLIEIDGENTSSTFGLNIQASNTVVRGLAINRFPDQAGNGFGIGIFAGTGSWVYGNDIGTDPTGMSARPNGQGGIWIGPESSGNRIGTDPADPSAAQRNVISGNAFGSGILIQSGYNDVAGNYIGVGSDGSTALGNAADGIQIAGDGNDIGLPSSIEVEAAVRSEGVTATAVGSADLAGNVIADNGAAGVEVLSGTGNAILGNSIYGNAGLGIKLDDSANNSVTPPTLVSASASGTTANTTYTAGTITSAPNTAVRIEFFSSTSCSAGGSGPGQTFLGFINVTTDANGKANFTANVPSAVPTTSVVTATATDDANNTSEFSACVTPSLLNDAWTRAKQLTLTGTSNPSVTETTTDQAILSQGESLWYKVQVQPGSTVAVTLTNLPASYQLALYKDIGAAYQQANSTTDLEHLSAEFAPDAFSPDAFSPDAFSPDAFSPDAFSPDAFSPDAFSPDAFSPDAFSPDAFSPDAFSPDASTPDPSAYTGAQLQSLLAVSAFPGNASQGVLVRTWENTGDFYIRVRGQNGAFDPSAAFKLTVIQQNLNCSSLQPVTTPTSLKAVASNYKTLVVTDYNRLPGSSTDKATLQRQLATFVTRPEVQGTVVDVSTDARVADANKKADANISCPIAKNYVAESIESIVNEYRAANPGLQYLVIVGGDNVIPFYRYPDEALLANESGFSPPVSDSSASQASLREGYTLTEDLYGSSVSLSMQANEFPVAGLAVGRLVETASEASGMLAAYLSTAGGVVPITHAPLVTGYDFLQPSASAVAATLQAATGLMPTTLLEKNGLPPTDPSAWTATQLESAFLGSRHDLVYLAGHFSAGSALAADYTTRMLTTDVTSSTLDMTNEIIFSAGCHSGYNTVDPDGISGVTFEPDWPQAFAQKRATLIAGTGYQYGDTDLIKYSDLLYVDFAHQLASGTPGVPVRLGQALAAAKQYYLANTSAPTGIDQKSVLEATLYGLPMLAVNLPNRAPLPTPPAFATPHLSTANPGQSLGLSSFDLSVDQSFTKNSVQLTDPTTGKSYTSTYLTVPGSSVTVNGQPERATTDTLSNPTEPVLPLEVVNANPTNNPNAPGPAPVLRGVGFRGGTYTDEANVLPLTSAPSTELSAAHATFQSSVLEPIEPWYVNYLQPLASGGNGATRLEITPAQYISSGANSITATQRSYSGMSFRLFYSDNTSSYGGNVPALAAPPSITDVTSTVNGTIVTFQARVTGAPSAGIQEVWVTYTGSEPGDPNYGKWQSLDLTQSQTDSTLWSGSLTLASPSDIRFMVQAVNGVGLVSLDTNIGAYFAAGVNPVPPSSPRASTTLTPAASTSSSNPSSGLFGTTPTFSVTLTSGGRALTGQTVTFALDGQRHQAVTDQNGLASVSFDLVELPNPTTPYSVQVSYAGSDLYGPSSASIEITVTKQATALCISQGTQTCSSTTPISVQYSDPSNATATLTDATGQALANKMVFFVVSSKAGPVFEETSVTDYLGRAELGPVTLPPGSLPSSSYNLPASYTLTASFGGTITAADGQQTTLTDPDYANSTQSTTFMVNPEDARASYTGTTRASTASVTSTTATVSLSATIKDITAVPTDPSSDPYPGDIRNATVTFLNLNTSPATVLCTAPVGLVNATNTQVGTATCNANLAVGSRGPRQYNVEVVAGGFYTTQSQTGGNNLTVITVSRPSITDSVTGGGYLMLSSSAGKYAGPAGSHANFGFTVKYTASGSQLVGVVNVIVHASGHVYLINSNALTNLGVTTTNRPATATVQSRATIIDTTKPSNPIVVDKNATLQLDMTDNAAKPDLLGITVWNKNGGLYFSSNWNGTRTVQQTLGGGDLSVR